MSFARLVRAYAHFLASAATITERETLTMSQHVEAGDLEDIFILERRNVNAERQDVLSRLGRVQSPLGCLLQHLGKVDDADERSRQG